MLNVLVAYPYWGKNVEKYLGQLEKGDFRLMVDSGAFTAWNLGKKITLEDYGLFLESISHHRPFHAIQLDVFGHPDASYANFLEMRKRGYDVMPVFTRGESLERLEFFYTVTDYILFGGIVTGMQNREYVKWFLRQNKGRKAHWLGFVNIPFIARYQPESVDASSWTACLRWGHIHINRKNGTIGTLRRNDFLSRPKREVVEEIISMGFSYQDIENLAKPEAWVNKGTDPEAPGLKTLAGKISTCSYIKFAQRIEKNFKTKVYLAASDATIPLLIYCYLHLKKTNNLN